MNNNCVVDSSVQHRFLLLDGLRGIAAMMVLGYHLFEAIAFAANAPEQHMFHGFLAVDFFFILSGFVMGYAYDKRWDSMTIGQFIRLRLIRLHPMVIMGIIIGILAFYLQGCVNWEGNIIPSPTIFLCIIMSLILLPALGGTDVRGNTELYPLNGPHWSLFFEYIGNLLYALLLHRLKDRWLGLWIVISAIALALMGLTAETGSLGYGWSSEPTNMLGGFLRLSISYPMGLWLWRKYKLLSPCTLPSWTALPCTLAIIILLSIPSFHHSTTNIFFQLACIIVAFPVIIWTGALTITSAKMNKAYSILGQLSYPLYATHYPLIYLYIHWINIGWNPFDTYTYLMPVTLAGFAILIGWVCSRFYDIPVRNWLKKHIH